MASARSAARKSGQARRSCAQNPAGGKEAAARRRKSIAALIEESPEQSGIRDLESAAALVARARATADLSAEEAVLLAERETRAARAP
jgi:hypothetical protein